MTPEALARLHAAAFTIPRPWTAPEFEALLEQAGVFVHCEGEAGFILGRVVVNEVELLTLAVDPDARRHGHGRRLVERFEATAAARAATRALLEVAEDNTAAQALYTAMGYRVTARRPRYYTQPDGAPVTALIMDKALPLK